MRKGSEYEREQTRETAETPDAQVKYPALRKEAQQVGDCHNGHNKNSGEQDLTAVTNFLPPVVMGHHVITEDRTQAEELTIER